MKKKIMFATVMLFVILAIPLSIKMLKHVDQDVELYKEAKIVETESDFAAALKNDGWIFAKGKLTGRAPVEDLNLDGKRLWGDYGFFDRVFFANSTKKAKEALQGDFLQVRIEIGPVSLSDTGQYVMDIQNTVYAKADKVKFLGKEFSTSGNTILNYGFDEVYPFPKAKSTSPQYKMQMQKSPKSGWLKVHVQDGNVVNKDLTLLSEEGMKYIRDASEGKTNKSDAVIGFLFFWAMLLAIVLALENKYIPSKN